MIWNRLQYACAFIVAMANESIKLESSLFNKDTNYRVDHFISYLFQVSPPIVKKR